VAVAVWIAVICLRPSAVFFLGVAVYLFDTVAAWIAVGSLDVAAEIVYGASFAKSVEVPDEIIVDNEIHAHSNDAPCSHLSILKVLFHEKTEHHYSIPNLNDSSVSDTTALPRNATTNHRRRRGPRLNQGQRRHLYEAAVPLPEVSKIRSGEAEGCQYEWIPAPLLEQAMKLPMPKRLLQKVTFSFCSLHLGTILLSKR